MDKIIKIDDVEGKVYELDDWKPEQGVQVKKYFNEKFKELKDSYEKLLSDFNWNKLIFESDISFTPIIGLCKHTLYLAINLIMLSLLVKSILTFFISFSFVLIMSLISSSRP